MWEARNKDLKYDREKRTRIFQNLWIDKFPWVVFDENAQEMYCKYCRKFPHLSDRKDALTATTFFSKVVNINKRLINVIPTLDFI
jgi:hypothetical protein